MFEKEAEIEELQNLSMEKAKENILIPHTKKEELIYANGYFLGRKEGAEFGYNKANEWQKISNWKDNSQFPKDELKTYLVRLYQDHCVVCGLNITEGYRQFYLEDNNEYIDPQDVIAWKEIVLPELKEV